MQTSGNVHNDYLVDLNSQMVDLRDQSVQNQKEFIHQLFGLTA
ncbi:hypothetical protein [Bacillus paranthracis]